jgi:hypothetical protein
MLLGAMALAIALASHAIIGALAMLVAMSVLIRERWGIVVLMGIGLLALPEVLIALNLVVPYPVLPALQGAGLGMMVLGARRLEETTREWRWVSVLVIAITVGILIWCPEWSGLRVMFRRYPILYIGATLGLGFAAMLPRRRFGRPLANGSNPYVAQWDISGARYIAVGIVTSFALDCLSRRWWTAIPNLAVGLAIEDLYHKIEYWLPYLLVLPTAILARRVADFLGIRTTVYALLALLCVPWVCRHEVCDPNMNTHALVQEWAHSAEFAKGGYWGSTGDRRWAQSPAQFALSNTLLAEVAAGRITTDTHIAQVEPAIILYQDTVLFSVYTGINADTYMEDWVLDRSTAAGRFYPIDAFHERMMNAPPSYIVIHEWTLNNRHLRDAPPTPPEYEELLNEEGMRLLRRRAL